MKAVFVELFGEIVVQLEGVLDDEGRVCDQARIFPGLNIQSVTRQSLATFSSNFWKTRQVFLTDWGQGCSPNL